MDTNMESKDKVKYSKNLSYGSYHDKSLHTLYNDCLSDSFESKVKIKFIHNQVV